MWTKCGHTAPKNILDVATKPETFCITWCNHNTRKYSFSMTFLKQKSNWRIFFVVLIISAFCLSVSSFRAFSGWLRHGTRHVHYSVDWWWALIKWHLEHLLLHWSQAAIFVVVLLLMLRAVKQMPLKHIFSLC